MGRAPCCDKANVKKGPWSPEEDAKLRDYIEKHGTGGNWIALPQKIGLKRCGKSCRLRWLNYLRPNIKHGGFSEEEDKIICSLYISIGSRWSIIAAQLPGRTDNDIKNYWNTRLKKKLLGKQRKEHQARRVSCIRQEMKKESGNFMVANNGNQNPYWPELPVPVSVPYLNQDPRLNDHASIRKLLIKLGGKFSDDQQQQQQPNDKASLQCPLDISSTPQQFYENNNNLLSSAASMNSLNNTCSQLQNTHYDVDEASLHMLQGLNSFSVELNEMVYGHPQRLDGLECFYGMVDGSTATSSGERTSWSDISSMVYPPIVSNYESCQQAMLQECAFEEPRYLGSQ